MSDREMPKEEPLDLVPIMNLVTILIPVLLMAIKSVEVAVIDTTLPAIGAPSEATEDMPDKPPLQLKVAITNSGIRILGANEYLYPEGRAVVEGAQAPPDVPCKSNARCKGVEDYDWADLSKKLVNIKKGAQADDRDSDAVVLMPESNIQYEVLVRTMDITRKTDGEDGMRLFPVVSIAGGSK